MLEPVDQKDDSASPAAPLSSIDSLVVELRSQLRSAIRGRLLWQMLAAVGAAFWLGLIWDRLFEPSASWRLVIEGVLGVASVLWLLTVALPRWRTRLDERSLLTLLHGHAPDEASLVSTAQQLREAPPSGTSQQLSEHTLRAAARAAERVRGVRLVREPASYGFAWFAATALAGVLLLGIARPHLVGAYANRIALGEEAWPRRVALTVAGFAYDPQTAEWRRVAARGEPLEIEIAADAADVQRLPTGLWARGLARRHALSGLTRVGPPSGDGRVRQRYRQRVERLDGDLAFTIVGGDARIRVRVIAAPRPLLSELEVTYQPPAYLEQPEVVATVATLPPLPEGSELVLRARSSKPLASVEATVRSESASSVSVTTRLGAGLDSFEADLPRLTAPCVVTLVATGEDGLVSEPFELALDVAKDTPPSVSLALEGVGRSVTRDARVPVLLRLDDDHALSSVGLRLASGELVVDLALPTPAGLPGQSRDVVDLLSRRGAAGDQRIELRPGDRLTLTATAADRYDLADRPISESQPIELEVVTPEELLARLGEAQRELRRSVDALLADVQRLRYELDLGRRRLAEVEPSTDQPTGREGWTAERRLDTRKASDGVRESARRAEELRLQAVNNRLDQPALIDRLGVRRGGRRRRPGGDGSRASRREPRLPADVQ